MNIYTLIGIKIGLTLVTSDVMWLGMNEITDLGSLISAKNRFLLELNMTNIWNIHWVPNSDLLMNFYFSGKISIVGESIIDLIETVHVSKFGINKGTYPGSMVAENNDELFIYVSMVTNENIK